MLFPPSFFWNNVLAEITLVLALNFTLTQAEAPLVIYGSGTTSTANCLWNVMEKMETRAKVPLHMTYRAIGSSSGVLEFAQDNPAPISHFASSDIPLNGERYDELSATETVLQLPVFVGAVSFFHSLPNTPNLNLTACTLAKIFSREITSWGDPEIVEINPQLVAPDSTLPIRVARRVDGSGSTSVVTQYLSTACPSFWPADNVGSVIDWPSGTLECRGSAGVEECIKGDPGTIGYLDAWRGHAAGFSELYVENMFGTKLTSAQAAARGGIAAAADVDGLLPDSASGDFSSVSLVNQPGEFTWPMCSLNYIFVRQDFSFISGTQEQALLQAFLQALYMDDYVERCVEEYGLTMVDGAALAIAQEGIDSLIVDPVATPFIFEEQSTIVIEGQGDYVLSTKRKSGAEVDIEALISSNKQLTTRVEELESMLQETIATLSQLTSSQAIDRKESGNYEEAVHGKPPP